MRNNSKNAQIKIPIDLFLLLEKLPCDENIYREHLSEKAIVKENKIKCNECKGEFQVKDNDSKSNRTLKKLIESQSYLSEQEISLKQKLEETTRKFFEFYDEDKT